MKTNCILKWLFFFFTDTLWKNKAVYDCQGLKKHLVFFLVYKQLHLDTQTSPMASVAKSESDRHAANDDGRLSAHKLMSSTTRRQICETFGHFPALNLAAIILKQPWMCSRTDLHWLNHVCLSHLCDTKSDQAVTSVSTRTVTWWLIYVIVLPAWSKALVQHCGWNTSLSIVFFFFF